ncbi:MAG: GlsB/YeaQ/YmgE family stress response membrane protein [Tepidisphaeraceae bacterium]|jgi:uncharacterized membrane protein YeaQ/YmgE (transglycosylase-associated protein family)
MLLGIFGWIVLGTVAGFIVSKFVDLRGDDPRIGVCAGVGGAIIGGWMYSLISGSAVSGFNVMSLLFAAIAATVALAAWHGWRWKSAA